MPEISLPNSRLPFQPFGETPLNFIEIEKLSRATGKYRLPFQVFHDFMFEMYIS